MSHTSSAFNKRTYKRVTIGPIVTSTPIINAPARRFTTSSSSRIDTSSSLNEDRIEDKLQKAKKILKRRKNTLENNRKLNKKRVIQLNKKIVTSTEWDTEFEESIDEFLKDLGDLQIESDDARINLFNDPCTPEKLRDAPINNESFLRQSPILRSSRFHLFSKRDIITQQNQLLPVNIPLSEVQNPKEIDEDEIKLNRTNNPKTYSSKDKNIIEGSSVSQNLLGIYWNAIYPPSTYTMSDILWEEFVEQNREEFPHLTSSPPVKEYESEFLRKYPDIPPKFESPVRDDSGMYIIRTYSDRVSQKWVTEFIKPKKSENEKKAECKTKSRKRNKRKQERNPVTLRSAENEADVYDLKNEKIEDVEFETDDQGRRMSLAEFRQKRKRMAEPVSKKSFSESYLFHVIT